MTREMNTMITRPMTAAEVRVGDRLVNEDRKPLVIFARTVKGQTTIRCDGSATINVPSRTPMGDVERRTRVEHVESDEFETAVADVRPEQFRVLAGAPTLRPPAAPLFAAPLYLTEAETGEV